MALLALAAPSMALLALAAPSSVPAASQPQGHNHTSAQPARLGSSPSEPRLRLAAYTPAGSGKLDLHRGAGASSGLSERVFPYGPQHFENLWLRRQAALRRGDHAAAEAALDTLLFDKLRSGWPNMFVFGEALATQALRALQSGAGKEAVRLAEAAVAMAPHRPSTHWTLASVRFRGERDTFGALRHAYDGLLLLVGEPPLLRAQLGNVSLVVLLSLFVASFVWVLVGVWRYAGVLSHDLRHVISTRPNHQQARLLAATLLVLPALARLPLAWAALVWLVVVGRYLRGREIRAAVVVGVYLAAAPLLLPWATEHLGYGGTLAESLYRAGRDAGAVDAAERLATRAQPSPDELFVLGMRARWAGDDEGALGLLQRAAASGSAHAALFTAIGNIDMEHGDLERAMKAYERALTVAPKDVTALFNLSRVYFAADDHERALVLRERAAALDFDRVQRFAASLAGFNAGKVIRIELPRRLLAARAEPSSAYAMALQQIWRFFGGDTERLYYTGSAVGALLLLLGLWQTRVRLPVPAICARCGAPACKICTEDLPDLHECGDCYRTATGARGTTSERQIRKAIEAYRFKARSVRARRVLPIFVVGTGQVLRGDALLGWGLLAGFVAAVLLWSMGVGLIMAPAAPWSAFGWPVALMAALVAIGLYFFSVWDSLRRER